MIEEKVSENESNFMKFKKIGEGFRIVSMSMKSTLHFQKSYIISIDAENGTILWTCSDWDLKEG